MDPVSVPVPEVPVTHVEIPVDFSRVPVMPRPSGPVLPGVRGPLSPDVSALLAGLTEEQILAILSAPLEVTADGQTVKERSAADLIELDKYLRGRRTPATGWAGMGTSRAVPPDSTGRY